MKEKPEGYPEFDELFDALDISAMANDDVVEYSNSRLRMLDEERDMRIFGKQQREEVEKKELKKGWRKEN